MKPIDQNSSKKTWLDVWHVNPNTNQDYSFIDGLRGVAILMVLACHHLYVNPKSGPTIQFIGSIFSAGGHGVMLFFALSGFLISWPFWKRKFSAAEAIIPPGYAQRRFWKIYPPLALSIVILTPVCIFLKPDWSYCVVALQWLTGIAFVLPVSGKLNPVMWTLVIEVQFYTILPLLFLALKKTSPKMCLAVLTIIFFAVPMSFRIITGLSATFHPDINPHFPSALDAFCLGVFIAGLDNMKALKKEWAGLGVIGVILWPLALLATAWLSTHPGSSSFFRLESVGWLEKIASGCLLLYVANPQHMIARILCAPWLRWCGIISYEWYLFHQPIILWSRNYFGSADGNIFKYMAIVGGSFLFSLIISASIYRFFSLPILKRGRAAKHLNHIAPRA